MKNNYTPFSADSPELRALHAAQREGVITRETFLAAVLAERGPQRWRAWAQFWLLGYGVALLLVGIIFFFAYNWAEMHRFEKFVLIEVALISSVLLAWRMQWRSPSGQALLIAASVLVGVLLAVFGQVYQTGADAWQLFFSWALLILPWVLMANSAALWIVWLVVAEAAIATWFHVGGFSIFHTRWSTWMVVGSLLPMVLLALRETMLFMNRSWLADGWLRPVLVLMTLGLLSVPAFSAIVFEDSHIGWLLPWIPVAFAGFVVYRWIIPDILQLTFVVFNVAAMVVVTIGRIVFEIGDSAAILWLIALSIVAVVAVAYRWLQQLAAAIVQGNDVANAEEGTHGTY